jgi:hypothetical protein
VSKLFSCIAKKSIAFQLFIADYLMTSALFMHTKISSPCTMKNLSLPTILMIYDHPAYNS